MSKSMERDHIFSLPKCYKATGILYKLCNVYIEYVVYGQLKRIPNVMFLYMKICTFERLILWFLNI